MVVGLFLHFPLKPWITENWSRPEELVEILTCYSIYITVACSIHKTHDLTLTVLVATIDAQWEGMADVGSARYETALLPPCPTIRVLSYSSW